MRFVTRGDMDGLTSAVLITEMEEVDSIWLIHPQDITAILIADDHAIVRAGLKQLVAANPNIGV
jgi:hypothetical protein